MIQESLWIPKPKLFSPDMAPSLIPYLRNCTYSIDLSLLRSTMVRDQLILHISLSRRLPLSRIKSCTFKMSMHIFFPWAYQHPPKHAVINCHNGESLTRKRNGSYIPPKAVQFAPPWARLGEILWVPLLEEALLIPRVYRKLIRTTPGSRITLSSRSSIEESSSASSS